MGSTVTAQYAYGNALIRKDGEYPLYDGLGSERTVTNASQTVTGTVNFDAFGSTVGTSGSSTNPYMYAATSGYRNDGDAGLMHVGARYYDAQVGMWTSRDTVLTEHPCLYCNHDRVNRGEPDFIRESAPFPNRSSGGVSQATPTGGGGTQARIPVGTMIFPGVFVPWKPARLGRKGQPK